MWHPEEVMRRLFVVVLLTALALATLLAAPAFAADPAIIDIYL